MKTIFKKIILWAALLACVLGFGSCALAAEDSSVYIVLCDNQLFADYEGFTSALEKLVWSAELTGRKVYLTGSVYKSSKSVLYESKTASKISYDAITLDLSKMQQSLTDRRFLNQSLSALMTQYPKIRAGQKILLLLGEYCNQEGQAYSADSALTTWLSDKQLVAMRLSEGTETALADELASKMFISEELAASKTTKVGLFTQYSDSLATYEYQDSESYLDVMMAGLYYPSEMWSESLEADDDGQTQFSLATDYQSNVLLVVEQEGSVWQTMILRDSNGNSYRLSCGSGKDTNDSVLRSRKLTQSENAVGVFLVPIEASGQNGIATFELVGDVSYQATVYSAVEKNASKTGFVSTLTATDIDSEKEGKYTLGSIQNETFRKNSPITFSLDEKSSQVSGLTLLYGKENIQLEISVSGAKSDEYQVQATGSDVSQVVFYESGTYTVVARLKYNGVEYGVRKMTISIGNTAPGYHKNYREYIKKLAGNECYEAMEDRKLVLALDQIFADSDNDPLSYRVSADQKGISLEQNGSEVIVSFDEETVLSASTFALSVVCTDNEGESFDSTLTIPYYSLREKLKNCELTPSGESTYYGLSHTASFSFDVNWKGSIGEETEEYLAEHVTATLTLATDNGEYTLAAPMHYQKETQQWVTGEVQGPNEDCTVKLQITLTDDTGLALENQGVVTCTTQKIAIRNAAPVLIANNQTMPHVCFWSDPQLEIPIDTIQNAFQNYKEETLRYRVSLTHGLFKKNVVLTLSPNGIWTATTGSEADASDPVWEEFPEYIAVTGYGTYQLTLTAMDADGHVSDSSFVITYHIHNYAQLIIFAVALLVCAIVLFLVIRRMIRPRFDEKATLTVKLNDLSTCQLDLGLFRNQKDLNLASMLTAMNPAFAATKEQVQYLAKVHIVPEKDRQIVIIDPGQGQNVPLGCSDYRYFVEAIQLDIYIAHYYE